MHLRINETRAYKFGPDTLQCQLCGTLEVNPIGPCLEAVREVSWKAKN